MTGAGVKVKFAVDEVDFDWEGNFGTDLEFCMDGDVVTIVGTTDVDEI